MSDLLEIVARSGGSGTLPSLGNILFVTETGSTTQSRLDGLGRIDKPFELQRAFQVAQPNDIIIVYGANSSTIYSVNVDNLRIFIYYYGTITIDFNNTEIHEIYCYSGDENAIYLNIQNIVGSKVNMYAFASILYLSNCVLLSVYCDQSCLIMASPSLSNCNFKSNVKSLFFADTSVSGYYTNLNIENFYVNCNATITFTDCTFNKSSLSLFLNSGSSISNCFFYDSKINSIYLSSSSLNFANNKFVRCLIDFSGLLSTFNLNGSSTTNKFIDCVLFRSNSNSTRIENTTWILKDCTIHNPNSSISSSGFFNVTGTCNLYLIDCKYELPISSPYAISNDYTGELQLINCQLPTNITGGKTPTVTSNVFIGTLPNIDDVLNNI